jgi:hypothetical protein
MQTLERLLDCQRDSRRISNTFENAPNSPRSLCCLWSAIRATWTILVAWLLLGLACVDAYADEPVVATAPSLPNESTSLAPAANLPAQPVSLVNDVIPVLTKHGCNAGTCHAKAGGGQRGFQLSLLGFEPAEDYQHLVIEGRGRRLSFSSPEQSLLLQKGSGMVPHGGGAKLPMDSDSFRTLVEWIRQGAHFDGQTAPKLATLRVEPSGGVVPMRSEHALRVTAEYSDGSKRDVTPLALFESNDTAMASVDEHGKVTILDIPGSVSIMVRYQGTVSVFRASVPQGSIVDYVPPSINFVDDHVFGNLKKLGIPPSDLADDSTFLRRVSLDIAGRLPTATEWIEFMSDNSPTKRDAAIERLLSSGEYADYFANKWTAMLKNRRDDASDITSNFAFYSWIRDSLLANKPYDQMVRELLAATGTVLSNPPVAWYKRVKDPKQQLEDVAQLFLGVRMQCAQCHHHPFEKWSQDDYYSLAAFFSQVGRKPTSTRGEDMIFHKRGVAGIANIKTGVVRRPATLGDETLEIAPEVDPRLKLADWMAQPSNPFFAKALVNRYWKHFFRRGLIEPEDDIRDSNPPTNPELLADLEKHFIQSGFDLKELVRTIVRSKAYQLSSIPKTENLNDTQNYSRYYPRRLQAEVLLDAIDDLAQTRTDFPNLPPGTRAIGLPDNSYNTASPFLRVFGRPENESVCECERVQTSSLAQSLHLMNAGDLKGKLSNAAGRAELLAKSTGPLPERIEEIYSAAFSRKPTAEEMATAIAYIGESRLDSNGQPVEPTRATRENFQDLLWALINSKEFLFNH